MLARSNVRLLWSFCTRSLQQPRLLELLCIVWGTRLLLLTTEICAFKVYFKLTFLKENCNFIIEKQNLQFFFFYFCLLETESQVAQAGLELLTLLLRLPFQGLEFQAYDTTPGSKY